MSEVAERITGLVEGFDTRVHASPADAWGQQSPCADWKARDVVAHVADNLLRVAAGLQGTEAVPIGADDDIVAGWDRAKAAFMDGITGDLSTMVPGPFGQMPAEQLIGRFVATDMLVHTWDLARAVGGDETLPADAVAAAYSGLKPMDAMIRVPGVFGAKVEAPEGADVQTEFLSFLGRNV